MPTGSETAGTATEAAGWATTGRAWHGRALRIYPQSGYIVVVLANIDPPAADRIADWLDTRLPTQG